MSVTPEPIAHTSAPSSQAPKTRTGPVDAGDRKRRPIRRWLFELATDLTWPAADQDRATSQIEAIRIYHRDLAIRAKRARHDDARAGWWSGPAPYGYRILRHRLRDHAGRLRTRRLLVVDDTRAPLVATIYDWYTDEQLTPTEIAARLAAHPDRYPPPVDHTTGQLRPWTVGIVRGILTQPAYLGYVTTGRTSAGITQPMHRWTWSIAPSHPALINATRFRAAYNRRQHTRQRRRTAQ